jgi:hypothetical protein
MRVYVCGREDSEKLKKLLEYDPYLDKNLNIDQIDALKKDHEANIIFARQDYWLKDGISLGLDREKYYLILSAVDEFLEDAEKKLMKSVPSIKRAESEVEGKVILEIEKERSESEQGLGMIFG